LTPNDPYSCRTAPLTPKCCILYIYSKNTGTEYFKYGIYSPFFSLKIADCFIILTNLVPVLFTFYIQSLLKVAFYIFIQQIQVLNILNMLYNFRFFFFSKCSFFHISYIFGSCFIHILYTECAKRFILYIHSTNIGTEYFKHGIYFPYFLFKMQFLSYF